MTKSEKKEVEQAYMRQVENDAKLFSGITPEVAEFPYGAEGARAITWGAWVSASTAMSEPDGAAQSIKDVDGLTEGAFTRAIGIFGNIERDFTRVINGLRRGAKGDTGETVELDRFGQPNIAAYMAGCRASVSVSVEDIGSIDLETFVAPWHGKGPVALPEFEHVSEALTYESDGEKWAILPYNLLWPWDKYRVIANLCAAGFENSVRGLLGGKAGAKLASELEDKAAVIDYESMNGVMVGYSKACNYLDDAFMREIVKAKPEYRLEYKPEPGQWGPTMELTLPRDEIRKWRAAGGNPQQLKRLRGVVYTMLLHENTPYWWKRYQVTLTIGQIERGLYNDTDHHLTDKERALLLASFDLLAKTHIDCTYPPKDKKTRHSHIDESKLAIHGLTLFPAVWVDETDAKGHVVNAAFKFHAMPPLDAQADKLRHAYTLPYLNGTTRLPAIGEQRGGATRRERIDATTYDVQTALAKYIRIAKSEGTATVYIDTLVGETEPFKVEEITTKIQYADAGYVDGAAKDADECKKEKKRQQQRMRNLRGRVKKDVLRVLPLMIENEATAEKPHYLNVDTAPGRRDGFTISRVKQTDEQRKAHLKPHTHFRYGIKENDS